MGGNTGFGTTRRGKSYGLIITLACLAVLAGGCNESSTGTDNGTTFDTSRLPRVSGAKEIFASAAVTNFTSPDPVAQTADTLDKTLAATGWQKYVPPNSSTIDDPKARIMSFKKGARALNVFITVAPAQNNATGVQYSELPLKTDLPFTKDASNIEYSPDRPLLSLVTAEPIDKTLDFYRKELGARGWSLWSDKLDAKQPANGPSGDVRERGGSASYVNDKEPTVAMILTIQNAEADKFKVEIKEWPVGILASMHRGYLNGGTNVAKPVDVSALPRLEGASEETARTSATHVGFLVPGPVENAIAATKTMLAADGWKQYVAPLEVNYALLLHLKKGPQGLRVSFTMPAGQPVHSGVDYSPTRLPFALPFPDDATDIVFDENRPYLNLVTAGTVDSARDFFNQQLTASGWSRLTAIDAVSRWPNATLDETIPNGLLAYYVSENQRPIVLSLQRRDDDKINAEIKLPPFAELQVLEAGQEDFGMPTPKRSISSGGRGGQTEHEVHAQVPAEVGTVLAFYRRELAVRNWKEETQGAIVNPDEVKLSYTSPEGPAVLKLGHKYDLTIVSLVQQIPKPAAKVEPAAKDDSVDAMMKQAQQMVREAPADATAKMNSSKVTPASNDAVETLRPLAGNDAPVPLPENAEDVDFARGRLEFSSAANVKSVAAFYRSTLKEQGWDEGSSVINSANVVVLNFSKARKAVSFTIMKMGNKTNVTAEGSALKVTVAEPAEPAAAPSVKAPAADAPAQSATEDDLIAEESGGLPVPKRHTMSDGIKTPFRRELKASVPLDLVAVLGFYRRELGKRNWKEESKGAVVVAENAVIAFSSGDGLALLTLGRKDGETTVNLVTKNPDAAAKAGVIPKQGQAKVLISNPNDVEAVITINKQTIKAVAGAGVKGPDGPILELAPGKYKFSVKLAGKPASDDELQVGADETWGLLIGPGGALPMHVY